MQKCLSKLVSTTSSSSTKQTRKYIALGFNWQISFSHTRTNFIVKSGSTFTEVDIHYLTVTYHAKTESISDIIKKKTSYKMLKKANLTVDIHDAEV